MSVSLFGLGDDAEDAGPAPVALLARDAMVGHALAYARRGLPVFPCNPRPGKGVKAPLVKGGFKAATTDEATIRGWWAENPGALIGMPMGSRSGMLALDPDAPKKPGDADGVAAWDALLAEHGGVPPTRCHRTPGGGRHVLFDFPAGRKIGISEGALAGKGINVRGDGGYVIMPPSHLENGRAYAVAEPAHEWTLAPAPEWLLDLIAGTAVEPQGLGPLPPHLAAATPGGIVLPEVDLPKPSPMAVAEVCRTFVRMLQDAPTAGEKAWWKTCELAMHTTGGAELAHALSAAHPDYKPETTQAKIDRHVKGGFGPPTCATLQKLYGEASPCPNCPYFGNPTTSPIAIARREAERTVASEDGTIRQRAVITIEGGNIATAGDAASDALHASDAAVYQRSGKLVRPVVGEVPASHSRTTIVARLAEVKVAGLRDALARHVDFQRFDGRAKKFVRIDPPRDLAEGILSREGVEWPFPSVAGCITTPTLRADGSLLLAPGYDGASRLYHFADPRLSIPPMPEVPTRTDAEMALRLLNALLDGFPFVGPVDRAVALSALMMTTLRGGMPVAPLHLIRAHTAGTGKSFLVDLASTIATGRLCPVSSGGSGEEEMEKRLTGLLLSGAPVVSLDNVNGDLDGVFLCQAIERPLVALRRLGTSDVSEVECRAAVFATGNNTAVKGDMIRRTLTCNLDANMEDPEKRNFDFDPLGRVRDDRGTYVAAVLTIALAHRGYMAAGGRTTCSPLGSFGGYSMAVREPLVWLGIDDPAASMEATRAADPERAMTRELFSHWESTLGLGKLYQAHEVVEKALIAHPPGFGAFLLLHFPGHSGSVSTLKFGRFLARIQGNPTGGRKLEMQPDKKHGHAYRLATAGDG